MRIEGVWTERKRHILDIMWEKAVRFKTWYGCESLHRVVKIEVSTKVLSLSDRKAMIMPAVIQELGEFAGEDLGSPV